MNALLGIPDLGWPVWAALIFVLTVDLGVLLIGIARIRFEDRHAPPAFRSELPPELRVIGGQRGPDIEQPEGKVRL